MPSFVLSGPVLGRWVLSDVFESELSPSGVVGPELRGEPVNVSCGKPFSQYRIPLPLRNTEKILTLPRRILEKALVFGRLDRRRGNLFVGS